MASVSPAAGTHESSTDRVPEVYRDFFDNGDWFIHKLVVAGSWGFLVLAIVAHVLAWAVHPWGAGT